MGWQGWAEGRNIPLSDDTDSIASDAGTRIDGLDHDVGMEEMGGNHIRATKMGRH